MHIYKLEQCLAYNKHYAHPNYYDAITFKYFLNEILCRIYK